MKRRNFLKAVGAAIAAPVALATAATVKKKPKWKCIASSYRFTREDFNHKFWSRAIVDDIAYTLHAGRRGGKHWVSFNVNFKRNATLKQRLTFCQRFNKVSSEVVDLLNERITGVLYFEGVPFIYKDRLDA